MGASRLYFASNWRNISGGTGLSRVNGPPGIARLIKNVIVAIKKIVITDTISRFNMYLPNRLSPSVMNSVQPLAFGF